MAGETVKERSHGLTLVELVIATTIGSILMLAVSQLLISTSRVSGPSSSQAVVADEFARFGVRLRTDFNAAGRMLVPSGPFTTASFTSTKKSQNCTSWNASDAQSVATVVPLMTLVSEDVSTSGARIVTSAVGYEFRATSAGATSGGIWRVSCDEISTNVDGTPLNDGSSFSAPLQSAQIMSGVRSNLVLSCLNVGGTASAGGCANDVLFAVAPQTNLSAALRPLGATTKFVTAMVQPKYLSYNPSTGATSTVTDTTSIDYSTNLVGYLLASTTGVPSGTVVLADQVGALELSSNVTVSSNSSTIYTFTAYSGLEFTVTSSSGAYSRTFAIGRSA